MDVKVCTQAVEYTEVIPPSVVVIQTIVLSTVEVEVKGTEVGVKILIDLRVLIGGVVVGVCAAGGVVVVTGGGSLFVVVSVFLVFVAVSALLVFVFVVFVVGSTAVVGVVVGKLFFTGAGVGVVAAVVSSVVGVVAVVAASTAGSATAGGACAGGSTAILIEQKRESMRKTNAAGCVAVKMASFMFVFFSMPLTT